MKMIDGHAHACGMFFSKESVLEYLNDNNIERIVLSAGEPDSRKIYHLPYLAKVFQSPKLIYAFNVITAMVVSASKMADRIDEGNEKAASMAQECPERILNTYWVNPADADCIRKMEDFRKNHSFCMIKMHQCWTEFDMNDAGVVKVIEWAEENGTPVFIHLKSKIQVKKFISFIKEYPGVTFILAHLIGIDEFDRTVGGNVYFDISCPLIHSVKMLKRAFDNFGAKRILLGSDAPYGSDNMALAIRQMQEAGMNDCEIELVCSENIRKILNINE
jgi:predicted TIM-barrel fold metal-dependent hydrolase